VSEPTTGGAPGAARTCASCGTELAQLALVCPSCHALIHAERLKAIAARAAALTAESALEAARDAWHESLELLPADSKQAELVTARIADLESRLSATSAPASARKKVAEEGGSWWKQSGAAIVAVVVLLLTKGKFLLLGLTKLKTLFSMLAFFGVYWTTFGWPLALGFVVGIYIHEMGHVAALKKHGIAATAPLFIPGVGAFILAKQHITDPRVDAEVGLAGPIYGFAAGLIAFGAYLFTDHPTWLAIAQLTGMINLFNLMPVWQLDGSRAFHALDGPMRWGIVIACAIAFWLTRAPLTVVVGGVAVWRAFKKEQDRGDVRTFLTFLGLIAALSWMASLRVLP
jgi:Zn-dependent protease